MIVHIHFHSHKTGVTKSVENIIPVLNKYTEARVFGYGINAPKISLYSLIRLVFSGDKTVIHTHRNNEIIFALLLRFLGGRFRLVFTRHAETKPSRFTLFLIRKADLVVSLNPSMSVNLPYPNTIIRHGVNTEIFKIGEKTKIAGILQENLISVVGRIRRTKGQLVVLKALIQIFNDNRDWGLLLIGKTDENEYAEEISSTALKNGINSQVHFMPETDEIIKYYQASAILVIASVSEGFGLVCLEAMSCGITTVATESVGIHSEVIKNGENGFLFPVNDHESLSRILSDIISKKVLLDPEVIRKTIVDNWSVERNVKELLKLYNTSPLPPSKGESDKY